MNKNVFRVLSIDGGGMRGYYSAVYLNKLRELACERFHNNNFDLSKQFQMIVGTSTGAIIAAGLAKGLSPEKIMTFYRHYGSKIFPKQLPSSIPKLLWHILWRGRINKKGDYALRDGLIEAFGNTTLEKIHQERNIALVIPAVNATTHEGWVFKTPHNKDSNHRDDEYSLVDVCLASSAAPVYRSLAAIKQPNKSLTKDMFVDGGLYANNPVLVALSEALRLAKKEQQIEVYCLGNAPVAGNILNPDKPHWGLCGWRFGGDVVELSIDAQSGIFDYLAETFAKQANRPVSIIRFPQKVPSACQAQLLKIDSTSKESFDIMSQLASEAAYDTNALITNKTHKDASKTEALLQNNFTDK